MVRITVVYHVRRIICAAVLCVLSGCSFTRATLDAPNAPRATQTSASEKTVLTPSPTQTPKNVLQQQRARTNPAMKSLLRQALAFQQQGALEKSAATIERALRIQPADALAWNRLALVRLQQSRWKQAEQLALKSNSFAAKRASLKLRNWRIIADARAQQGNRIGAAAARAQAQKYTH